MIEVATRICPNCQRDTPHSLDANTGWCRSCMGLDFVAGLTEIQLEALQRIADGTPAYALLSNWQIRDLRKKLDAFNITHAVAIGLRRGYIR